MPLPSVPVVEGAGGLVLRAWTVADVPATVRLFGTDEMARRTPLPRPFDTPAATAYVVRAAGGPALGVWQWAVTIGGTDPLGEVVLFASDEPGCCELAFAVGAEHRGQGLAARAVHAVLAVSPGPADGFDRARLRIAPDNAPSRRVAHEAGFALTDEPLVRPGEHALATWRRPLRPSRR